MPDDTRLAPLPVGGSVATPRSPWNLPRTPFAFLWHYIRHGFGPQITVMTGLYGLSTGVDTAQTYILGQLVNVLTGARAGDAVVWFGFLCSTWFGGYLVSNGYTAMLYYTQTILRVRIHDDMFAYLLDHSPRYFLDQTSGALAHKIRTAAGSGMVVIDYVGAHGIRFLVLFGVTGLMLARTAPRLLLPSAVFVVFVCVLSVWLASRLRAMAKESSHASSEQAGRMSDTALNWDLVRSFSASWYERLSLVPFNRHEADTFTRLRFAAIRLRLLLHVLSFSFLAWLAWQSLSEVRAGAISIGTFTMLISLYMLVGGHIRSYGDAMFIYFEHLGLTADAIGTILKPHEIVDPPNAGSLRVTGGAISIRDMNFAYADGTPVFQHFNLEIAAGEKVGLVGASGAGKSTLIKLIRRQFLLQSGSILIDGQDVAHATWDSVHDAFAEVPQNPGMFHRSVRENIAYGRPDATDDEIVAAAKLAHCHEFIASRAKAYDSIVGEKGMKLSGGERQRVAIARAFLKNAPILLLDEATSSLDSEAEHLIQNALLSLMDGRTVIAIAHRLSTIMSLDRIVVLEGGKVVEQGSHAALLAKGGAYARLWQHQAGGFM